MIWIGALAGQMMVQLSITGDCAITEEYLFRKQLGRIRDVGSDAGGALYILTDGPEGPLYRVDLPPAATEERTHL